MLDVCPMCGHGKKYVPTHVATMDEINRQVFATRPAPERHNELREALLALRNNRAIQGISAHIRDLAAKDGLPNPLDVADAALAEQAAPVKEGVK